MNRALIECFKLLDIKSLRRAMLVCKQWNRIAKLDEIWKRIDLPPLFTVNDNIYANIVNYRRGKVVRVLCPRQMPRRINSIYCNIYVNMPCFLTLYFVNITFRNVNLTNSEIKNSIEDSIETHGWKTLENNSINTAIATFAMLLLTSVITSIIRYD